MPVHGHDHALCSICQAKDEQHPLTLCSLIPIPHPLANARKGVSKRHFCSGWRKEAGFETLCDASDDFRSVGQCWSICVCIHVLQVLSVWEWTSEQDHPLVTTSITTDCGMQVHTVYMYGVYMSSVTAHWQNCIT